MQIIDLNGTWKLRWYDGRRGRQEYAERDQTDLSRYIDAQVPGEIHLDVWKAGWIEDPCVGTNVLAARWVEEMLWSYRREFEVPAGSHTSQSWLVFEGLDLAARIVLNGQEIGRHTNTFYPCRIETTGKLRSGTNVLTVHLDSGVWEMAEKPSIGYYGDADTRWNKRHWMRKPQFQFGWDWAPRLVNVGIFGAVRLEMTDAPARIEQLVPVATLSDDLSRGSVRVRLFIEGLVEQSVVGELHVQLVESGASRTQQFQILPGHQSIELTLHVENPALWWPRGHGEQNYYTLCARLTIGSKLVGRKSKRIGFRHVHIDQSVHPVSGTHFVVTVNKQRIFCKGANFVPADMILARIDRDRYVQLIDRAVEANFNFLRVWGGGLYESEDFYELCDSRGILVWQEFIYACAKYPMHDQEFFDNAKSEAIYQIRRLANHPSLIIWCGNNELEMGNWRWNYDRGVVYPDYAFFHLVLPQLLKQEDSSRFYQPSSPWSGSADIPPDADDMGDQHPWDVGFSENDFRKYRELTCRFASEGGMLGPTALPTMRACLGREQTIHNFAWRIHDNGVDSWAEPSSPDQIIEFWLGKNLNDLSVEEYTYWGGLLHGEALREYCENFRVRMFDSAAAVFWMYNDCWPATRSWTIVDYYLRRTPAFWSVRRALHPISIVLAIREEQLVIYGINDTLASVAGTLDFGFFSLDGQSSSRREESVALPPNSSTPLAMLPVARWPNPKDSIAFAMLTQNGVLLARNRLIRPLFKEMNWAKPEISVRRDHGYAIFESASLVWGVCLDLDGDQPLEDNFFDLYPGVPYPDFPLS